MGPDQLLDLFTCPHCGAPLLAEGPGAGDTVVCGNGHAFPRRKGFLDLSGDTPPTRDTQRTFESFGYEWNTFDDVRDEDAEFARVYFRDLDTASLEGKVGLDAGCGKGRYTRFLAPHLGALVALDGSSAVEAAARNLSGFGNVLVVKADLRTAPVAAGRLDLVVSLGVLHHLAEPRAGFERLTELLAPGGSILVYLYSRPATMGVRRVALGAASLLRKVTVRIPLRVLRVAAVPVAVVLWSTVVAAGRLGERARIGALAGLPMAGYRGKPLRSLVLDTFDRLSAPVEHRYVWDELAPWFDDAGLMVETVREEAGWFVLARRPLAAVD